jgi:nuclear pore complex protein Nup98-Nup96
MLGQFANGIGSIYNSAKNAFGATAGNSQSTPGQAQTGGFNGSNAFGQGVGGGNIFSSTSGIQSQPSQSTQFQFGNTIPQTNSNSNTGFNLFGVQSSQSMPFGQQQSSSSLFGPTANCSHATPNFGGNGGQRDAFGQSVTGAGVGTTGQQGQQSGNNNTGFNLFGVQSSQSMPVVQQQSSGSLFGLNQNGSHATPNLGESSGQPGSLFNGGSSDRDAFGRLLPGSSLQANSGSTAPSGFFGSNTSGQLFGPNAASQSSSAPNGKLFNSAPAHHVQGGNSSTMMHLPPRPHLKPAATRPNPWYRTARSAWRSSPPSTPTEESPQSRASGRSEKYGRSSTAVSSLLRVPRKRTLPEESWETRKYNDELQEQPHGVDESPEPASFKRRRKLPLQDELILDVATPLRKTICDDAPSSPVKLPAIKPNFIRHDAAKLVLSGAEAEIKEGDLVNDSGKSGISGAETEIKEGSVPSLTREMYFSRPSIEELSRMSERELMKIRDFEICHERFGSIKWPGFTDVRSLDLDKVVTIKQGKVHVYADSPPPLDTELNKNAVISLNVKRAAASEEEATRLCEKLQAITERAGHTFISYDLETWVFKVPNFEAAK